MKNDSAKKFRRFLNKLGVILFGCFFVRLILSANPLFWLWLMALTLLLLSLTMIGAGGEMTVIELKP